MSNDNPESNKKPDESGDIQNPTDELEALPPELKRFVQASLSMQRISSISSISPILEKINESHISKILEIVEKDDERTFTDTQASRKYTLINILVFLIFLGLLTVFLVNKDLETYRELLKLLIIYAGGLGSGFGLKGYIDKKNK